MQYSKLIAIDLLVFYHLKNSQSNSIMVFIHIIIFCTAISFVFIAEVAS